MNIWDFFKDILTSGLGSFGTGFGLVVFILWIAVKAGKIIERYKVIDKVVGKLESKIDKTVDKIEINIDKIKEDISEIKAFIAVSKRDDNSYAQSQSPLSLNDKGKSVAEKLQAKKNDK